MEARSAHFGYIDSNPPGSGRGLHSSSARVGSEVSEPMGELVAMQRLRTYEFVFGLVFLLSAASFTFGDTGVHWMWQDTPVVAGVLLAVSFFFWVLLALKVRSGRGPITR